MPLNGVASAKSKIKPGSGKNIREILEIILPRGRSICNSEQLTGALRPDYALLLKSLALFRGEEKSPSNRDNPKEALSEKLVWAYRRAPYILGEC